MSIDPGVLDGIRAYVKRDPDRVVTVFGVPLAELWPHLTDEERIGLVERVVADLDAADGVYDRG